MSPMAMPVKRNSRNQASAGTFWTGLAMTLRCILFGHLRSRSRASFDDKNNRWLSPCKRCRTLLVREAPGRWRPLPPESQDPVPAEPDAAETTDPPGSDAPRGSAGETPSVTPDSKDAPERGCAAGVEYVKEPV